jgi:hypothetical protein
LTSVDKFKEKGKEKKSVERRAQLSVLYDLSLMNALKLRYVGE